MMCLHAVYYVCQRLAHNLLQAALLLKENAPLDVTDIMGLTPRDIARNKKNEKLRQLIHSATDGA